MTSEPEFSVAIPAWGSSAYISDALGTLMQLEDPNLEVIVSVDPGSPDRDETLALLHGISGGFFQIIEPSNPLSMAEHYEWCIANMRGRWVTILGADDGLLPWGLQLVRNVLRAEPNADALMFRRCYYFWPGVEQEYGDTRVAASSENTVRVIDGSRAFQRALMGGGEHFDLPQIYTNNFVRNDVIARIREASNDRVLHERNPDVYSGVAVAHFATRIIRCEIPAFWTGTSPSSMGLKQTRAIVGDSAVSLQSVRADFVEKSNSSGHVVAPEVGDELWLVAQDSPTYLLSAYLQFLVATGGMGSLRAQRALRLAFSATLGRVDNWSPKRGLGSASPERKQAVRDLLRERASANGLLWAGIVISSLTIQKGLRARLLLQRASRRSARVLARVKPRVNYGAVRVTDPRSLQRLSDANAFIKSKRETLLPGGIEMERVESLKHLLKRFITAGTR